MPKKKPQHFHAGPEKKVVVKPKGRQSEAPEMETILWRDIAPDTFKPDKPDQELDQIMSYRDTHRKKPPKKANKRAGEKRN